MVASLPLQFVVSRANVASSLVRIVIVYDDMASPLVLGSTQNIVT